jgi:UDP-N-acetylmuramate dehydrogenase
MISIARNHPLQAHTTFGVPAFAAGFVSVSSLDELQEALKQDQFSEIKILGGGSNMLWTQDYKGLIIHINTKGISLVEENENNVLVEVAAGEQWHDFVLWALENNLGGVENLALIPGSVGAAPIQNIGAYGVELESCFERCTALEKSTGKPVTFNQQDCQFGYRQSIFKATAKDRYVITAVYFRLNKPPHQTNIAYGALENALGDKTPTIQNVAQAVMDIRAAKLPDPQHIGNCGSFFKNPVVPVAQFKELQYRYPALPHYTVDSNQVKIPAAWLIDTLGFKGYREGDAGVHQHQPLVLVNHGQASGKDLYALAQKIKKAVWERFEIALMEEVNIF